MQHEPDTGSGTIVLDESLCVDEAGKFHARLRAISSGRDVTLDGSRVTLIDTSGLQLLAALSRQVREQGHRLVWVSPSSVLVNTARLTGLSALLGLEVAG
ncbi:MAG: STAS domain-containing protein [Pseudomonadota bacterium]